MLTALTLVSNTVLYRLTYPLAPHYALLQSQSSFTHVFNIPSLLQNTQTRHDTTVHLLLCASLYMLLSAFPKLSTMFYSQLYIPDCISQTLYTVLLTAVYPWLHFPNFIHCSIHCCTSLEYSISSNGKVLAALMSEALWVITLLGTVALCYNILIWTLFLV
jgi:hypothetical protein